MKHVEIISFTEAGATLAETLREGFASLGYPSDAVSGRGRKNDAGQKVVRVGDWAKEHFATDAVLIFIGAAGIAVRAIAPHVKDKKTDPAVIVTDEKGRFVIPILSGHIGEANHFAEAAAALTGGQTVLTTATDVNGLFAVDVLAHRNGLILSNMTKAKLFSAGLLTSRRARIIIPAEYADVIRVEGEVPAEAEIAAGKMTENWGCGAAKSPESSGCRSSAGSVLSPEDADSPGDPPQLAVITPAHLPEEAPLQLIPRCLIVGVGCRRGKGADEIGAFLRDTFDKTGLDLRAVAGLYSIDLKKEEAGLIKLAEELDVPFETFDAETLKAVEGDFTPSAFVAETTGVDNVCERAACAAGAARLLLKKTARDGVTLAVGIRETRIRF